MCFDVTAEDVEIANTEVTLDSFYIQDDCHDTLFLVDLTTAIHEVNAKKYGMRISNQLQSEQIEFSLEAPQSIKFDMFDLLGRLVKEYPMVEYTEGAHSLDLGIDHGPGVYILVTEIKSKRFTTKIICQ
ncbi:MAG: T9SS type A sorting domain-containing protein [Saprospiraceae bacterium]|nr:T9SS type A sorting domain-containing protein [Saprospiraceae bacterium]MBP8086518.1 T9SS type A sorting domain-containing protein [Saprospiraceae bacterium]